jgi:hypothetical protein
MDFYIYHIICNLQHIIFLLQFYTHLSTGVQLASKNEVLRYIDEAELPEYVNGDCDTSSEDNVRISMLNLVY